MKTLRLGLIGGNIPETRSVALHVVSGLSIGRNVTYDLLIPEEQGVSFAEMLARCAAAGFDGINVTYPYKEEVLKHVKPGSSVLPVLGASNTIKFSSTGALAYNTDHTGFVAAYRATLGAAAPGRVLVIGTGGAGRAITFGLADLGAEEIVVFDTAAAKAIALRDAVKRYSPVKVTVADRISLDGMDGVINCTPLGMDGRPGSALPADADGRPRWALDSVYTPEHTLFRAHVEKLGAEFISGYELYYHQGVQAFKIFAGTPVRNETWLRSTLRGQ
jgi:shikimate dehydrogenase